MGAGNVKAVYALWSSLEDLPHRVLCYMAVVSHDGPSPRYWGGREALALAAGRPVPDPVRGNPAVTQARRAAFKVVDRALAALAAAGAIVQTATAHPGRNAEYRLNMVGQAALFDGRALTDPIDTDGRCGHPKASGELCIAWPRKGSNRCVAHQECTPVSGPYGPRSVDPMDPGEWTNGPRSVDIMHPAHRGPEEEQEQVGVARKTGEDEYLDLDTDVQVARARSTHNDPHRCVKGYVLSADHTSLDRCSTCDPDAATRFTPSPPPARRGDPCPDPADPATPAAAPHPTGDPTDASAAANALPPPTHPPPSTTGHHPSASPPTSAQDPTSSPAPAATPPPPQETATPAAGDWPIVHVRQHDGTLALAELREQHPTRHVAKVVYLASRTGAWIALKRIVNPDQPDAPPPYPHGLERHHAVWVAALRKGIEAHRPADDELTACRRSMRTGHQIQASQARARHDATWCPKCWPTTRKDAA